MSKSKIIVGITVTVLILVVVITGIFISNSQINNQELNFTQSSREVYNKDGSSKEYIINEENAGTYTFVASQFDNVTYIPRNSEEGFSVTLPTASSSTIIEGYLYPGDKVIVEETNGYVTSVSDFYGYQIKYPGIDYETGYNTVEDCDNVIVISDSKDGYNKEKLYGYGEKFKVTDNDIIIEISNS